MAKRKITQTSVDRGIQRHNKAWSEGNYIPWFRAADIPSEGTAREAWGKTHGRIHEFASTIEYQAFLHYDHLDSFVGIYEQFPLLPVEEVAAITKCLGIKPHCYRGTKILKVFTLDFLIRYQPSSEEKPRFLARSVKSSSALLNSDKDYQKVLETLEIEKAFCRKNGIDWKLITTESLNPVVTKNLIWIGKDIRESAFGSSEYEDFLDAFETTTLDSHVLTLKKVISQIAMRIKKSQNDTYRLFRHAVWYQFLELDLTKNIISPLVEISNLTYKINYQRLTKEKVRKNA